MPTRLSTVIKTALRITSACGFFLVDLLMIKLIVGLRNPGPSYESTRHNAGGWFLQALASHYQQSFALQKKMHGEMVEISIEQQRCFGLLPLTFMNHSGQAVRAVCDFYRIEPKEVVIVHDELDLPAGRVKFKTGGGHGGHNGLRDIISHLGSTEFHRLRLGIGHPGHRDLVLDYVLGKPSQHDKLSIMDAIDRTIEVMPLLFKGQLNLVMNQLNTN